jgi:hypothetical protein
MKRKITKFIYLDKKSWPNFDSELRWACKVYNKIPIWYSLMPEDTMEVKK